MEPLDRYALRRALVVIVIEIGLLCLHALSKRATRRWIGIDREASNGEMATETEAALKIMEDRDSDWVPYLARYLMAVTK